MENEMIFGIRPLMEALDSGKEIDKVFIQTGLKGELSNELRNKLRDAGVSVQLVPVEKLNRLTKSNHQGVVAYIACVTYQAVEPLASMWIDSVENPIILVLDRLTDVRNIGAIARTAECAGVQAIVVPEKGSARLNADAIKTSAGALHKIAVCKAMNLNRTVDFLKEAGYQIVVSTEKADGYCYDVDFKKPTVIIMGSEEDGVSETLQSKADARVKIPLLGSIQSLNVSVAAGIVLFEAVRQRGDFK